MTSLPYFRLIVLTVGTLLPFFWMIVILGHRRQRNFERIFFFLCLALTCFCGSSLLELNAELYYGTPPYGLQVFSWTFLCLGLWFLPALIVHLHVEYASLRELVLRRSVKWAWLAGGYLPVLLLFPYLLEALRLNAGFGFTAPSRALGVFFQIWLVCAIAVAAYWQWRFKAASPDNEQRNFHKWIFGYVLFALGCFVLMFYEQRKYGQNEHLNLSDQIILWLVVIPLIGLLRDVQKHNFLQLGRQRNLSYAVLTVFLGLLYLSFVRRASLWLEPYLPPEASAALLLFLPVVFFEPLQRVMRQSLRETAQTEVDRAQKLLGPINEAARSGDVEKLRGFAERWIAEQLQLAEVTLSLDCTDKPFPIRAGKPHGPIETFELKRGTQHLGSLRARPYGAMISGETYAALELICEQLPAAFDLCRLIEEKLQLERELAERERLALVGQMAASISHNLKNPLGSIKTILQVQMESPELPRTFRQETQMVLEEINRLSTRLNQLLQFSRPGARAGASAQSCNLAQVTETVANVLRHAADERHVSLQFARSNGEVRVAVAEESANDILSNVVLNAIEAAPNGGHVQMSLQCAETSCTVAVEDDGPGISAADRAKVLQPFFTTKARGTGLGLAIVDRRLQEAGGSLEIKSPVRDSHGTEIRLYFPLEVSR
jgi:signal transduction histidine kinase